MAKKRVGIIQGGMSSEREVSLKTGAAFLKAIKTLDYPFEVIDAGANLPEQLRASKIDCALLALHGKYGEDGTVQGILEYMKIPYTGSGVQASSLAMNKIATKQILTHWGVPTPDFQVLDLRGKTSAEKKSLIENFKSKIEAPLVIKPAQEGSAVGVTIVNKEKLSPVELQSEITAGLTVAAQYDRVIIIEKYIPGREVTIPIWLDRALPIIEIRPKGDFYDYKRKYTAGETEYVVPAPLSEKLKKDCEHFALETFKAVGCRQYARVDMRITPDDKPFILEINTLPGCTETSLFPKSAAKEGISFEKIIETLVESATLDYA